MNLALVKQYIENPEHILDIGANVGQFYEIAKATWPKANILSIEGNPYCQNFLSNTNPNNKICLLDYEPKLTAFFLNKNHILSTGNSIYKELTEHFSFDNTRVIKIKTHTLDNILPYQIFDLVKLDTQGSEIDIMKGGKNLIQRAKGVIVEVSHKPYNLNAPLSYQVVDYMLKNNFLLKETLNTNSKSHQSDFFFVNEWWYYFYKETME